jgi:hypothetical protein
MDWITVGTAVTNFLRYDNSIIVSRTSFSLGDHIAASSTVNCHGVCNFSQVRESLALAEGQGKALKMHLYIIQ